MFILRMFILRMFISDAAERIPNYTRPICIGFVWNVEKLNRHAEMIRNVGNEGWSEAFCWSPSDDTKPCTKSHNGEYKNEGLSLRNIIIDEI